MHLRDELHQRGFIYQVTNDRVFDLFDQGGQALYFGVDPTADSLHLGNFTVFMHAVHYMKRGNILYVIIGGATGMVGDPGGKDSERVFLEQDILQHNVDHITKQVTNILHNLQIFSGRCFDFHVINNQDFYKNMSYLQFLRDVGKHITVNTMINKETVKKRIFDPDKSISYTEFSYMLMQAYDFLRLYEDYQVTLQIAGSDQWGNIVTGVELVRKKFDVEVYGVTSPLIIDSSGKKFGKSEGNALWLDSAKTTPFMLYQYFINVADGDVPKYLKLLTLLDINEIDMIVQQHQENPTKRYGQEQLAYYVVRSIFGEKVAQQARYISRILFEQPDKLNSLKTFDTEMIQALVDATGGINIYGPQRVIDICTQSQLTSSNSEAKKQILAGAIYVNEKQVDDVNAIIDIHDTINGVILLRKGKKVYKVLRWCQNSSIVNS